MSLFARKRKPTPQPAAAPQPVRLSWQPEALPQGEVMPLSVLADLASHRDAWSGSRDTDRRQ